MSEINYQCPVCLWETHDQYMVTDECWHEAGLKFTNNLHLPCLEALLRRPLVKEDFTDAPINEGVFKRFEKIPLVTGEHMLIVYSMRDEVLVCHPDAEAEMLRVWFDEEGRSPDDYDRRVSRAGVVVVHVGVSADVG